jgi:hypothetical protein
MSWVLRNFALLLFGLVHGLGLATQLQDPQLSK